MKTKTFISKIMMLQLVVVLSIFISCKKEEVNNTPDPNSLRRLAQDEQIVLNASEEIVSDVNDFLSGGTSKEIQILPCNATIDSSNVVNDTITYTVTFDGLNCPGTRHRQGTALVKKHVNTHWGDVGAVLYVTLVNLKVTIVASGKWVILNGTKTFENISGGYVFQLGNGTVSTIEHRVTGSIEAQFEDNTTRTWQIARNRTITGTPGSLIVTHGGFGSAGGYNNLVVWGVNRDGEDFYTQITLPVVFKQACGWDPCQGVKVHNIPSDSKSATVTFGYDSNQQLVSSGNCPTHYKLDWIKGNYSGTLFLPL